jgi:diguanylate cyclase (GGDEF)-like protein
MRERRPTATWHALSAIPRIYVAVVCLAGLGVVGWAMAALGQIDSALVVGLFVLSMLISVVKVTLPGTASTLSLAHVLGYLALFAVGPQSAVLVTAAGAWSQCRFRTRQPIPTHKMLFSVAALALAMASSGEIYERMGGRAGVWDGSTALMPFVAAATIFFLLNTGLVAMAIAMTTTQPLGRIWCDTFLPTWPAYLLGAAVSAGSLFAIHHPGRWFVFFLTLPLGVAFYNLRVYLQQVDEATTDALTGLRNRRFGLAHAAQELARAARQGTRLTVVLADLDGLKLLNDTYGHGAGDDALRAVAQCLQAVLRSDDTCARYGGDEFLMVLSDCGLAEAHVVMRDVQAAVKSLPIEVRDHVFDHVGISVGVAAFPDDHESLDRLLEVADARLYRNKSRQPIGEDRSVLART